MSKRIKSARESLFQKMRELGTPGNWEHIMKHCGMFTFTGITRMYSWIIQYQPAL
jgi:aspartate aminotransferase